MPQFLNFIIARQIKVAIWNGGKYSDIAEHFAVSQPTISNIANGRTWNEVPWPDNSSGALPISQRIEIQNTRYGGSVAPFSTFSVGTKNAPRFNRPAPNLATDDTTPPRQRLDPRAIEAEFDRQQAARDAEAMKAIMAPMSEQDREDERRAHEARLADEAERTSTGPKLDEDFWEMLVARHATNPFVEAAMNGSLEARIAVVSTFQALPEDQWASDRADVYIKAALKHLLPVSE